MFDQFDPSGMNLTRLLMCKVVLVMCDANRPQDEPKMVGLVKDPQHWREAHKEMHRQVPDGHLVKILVWELRGDADELAASEDIIGGL